MDEQLEGTDQKLETGLSRGPGSGVEQWIGEVPEGHPILDPLALGPHCQPPGDPRAWPRGPQRLS